MGLKVSPPVAPIPANGLLLHVGVFKTGTTALQETLGYSNEMLSTNDVLYRGPASWKRVPLRELAATKAPAWQALLTDVAEHRGRTIISSENLCGCSDDEAADIVQQLAGNRPVKILITIRAISELLPSTWQQFLKRRMSQPFDEWVAEVLSHSEDGEDVFWHRNDFPAQVRRWGSLVGTNEVIVVVSEKSEPDRLLRLVEQLLSLPDEGLQFHPSGKSNRSLSMNSAELLRRVNEGTTDLLDGEEYRRLVRLGVFPAIYKLDQPGLAPISLPTSAAEVASAVGARQAAQLRESGARVIGNLDALARSAASDESVQARSTDIAVETAAAGIVGAITARGSTKALVKSSGLRSAVGRIRRLFRRNS